MSSFTSSFLSSSGILMVVLSIVSCSNTPPPAAPSGLPEGAWWTTQQPAGSARIIISLDEQRVALFKQGQLVGLSPISSGREGHDTRPGNFRISEKDENHHSTLYGAYVDADGQPVMEDVDVRKDPKPPGTRFLGADMKWFMRVNGAIGMHRGYLPGYPASHGCIRLPGSMASLFFHATPYGTPVEIRQNAALIAQMPQQSATIPIESKPSLNVKAEDVPTNTGVAQAAPKPQPKKTKKPAPGATLYWDGT